MGLSASQARLLSLTARQSNLEFEGQQINQQRTNLSNQSANYYNSLLTMTVPTPPSTDDYTTIKYSFVIGGNDATIAQVLPQDNKGNYLVEYTTTLASIGVQENTAYKITASANASSTKTGKAELVNNPNEAYNTDLQYYVQTFREDDEHGEYTALTKESERYSDDRIETEEEYYNANGQKVTAQEALDNNNSLKAGYSQKSVLKKDSNVTFYDKYGNQVDVSAAVTNGKLKDEYTALVKKESDEIGYSTVSVQLADRASYQNALDKGEKVTKFQENTSDNTYGSDNVVTYSASNDTTFSTVGSEYKEAFINAGLDINEYYQYKSSTGIRFAKKEDVEKSANNSTLSITTFAVASMNKTQKTQLSGVQIEFDTTGRISSMTDAEGNTYTMTASTETDDNAYEDAYNQYTYDQYVYDQKQNEINAHIEILQAQDKNLELRLSQLNTEHSAIQTEMDAVNKVISKNIETSFKTFNA